MSFIKIIGGIIIKPIYTFFFKNDEAIDDLLKHAPFNIKDPVMIKRCHDKEIIIEYEHFNIYCFKVKKLDANFHGFCGLRCCQVLVEDELYDGISDEIKLIFNVIMQPYGILGGRIVRINKLNKKINSCSINIKYDDCSSKEYGMTCDTCINHIKYYDT